MERPESILTWKRNQQVLELLGGITSGAIPLTHDGLNAAGSGRHIDHLRSLLQHHGSLPKRDEHLARFEVWLDGNDDRGRRDWSYLPDTTTPPGRVRGIRVRQHTDLKRNHLQIRDCPINGVSGIFG